MEYGPLETLPILKYLASETEKVCRLCLSDTNDEDVSLDDSIKLKRSYFDETVTFLDMFKFLSVPTEPLLPQVLCMKCATMTKTAYLFKKICEYSNETWNSILDRFSICLDQPVKPNVRTIYLMIKDKENIMLTSRKTITPKNKQSVISKVKEIPKAKHMNRKVKKNQQQSPVTCEECGERLSSKSKLNRHMKIHSNKRHPCPQCPKVYATRPLLRIHTERVHAPKKFRCPKCSMRFGTEKILKYHDKQYHEAALCKLCFIQLPSRKALRTHLDKHEVNKCPRCNKNFMNRQTFKLHLKTCGKIENKKPNFFCDICKKGYVTKNSIRSHLKTDHGFGNVLSCNWCGKKYDAISRLRNHQVKHTKEKNFHCEQCGGKFVTPAALVNHIRLHTGEKPYPCDLCNESFLSASRRSEHKRRKHFAPTQECHICHVKFITGNQLKKHAQRHYDPQSKLFAPEAEEPYYRNEYRQLSQIMEADYTIT